MASCCWSGECGGGARRAGWVGPTALLCVYGFCSMMRPVEPFLVEFFTGTYKNLTTEQVSRQVYPVWTYSSLVLLVPVLLLTDFLRYKPVIVLQGLTYVASFLLVLVGPGVVSAQLALFSYSVATAADVAYFSYIYAVVHAGYYQRVTGYVMGAVLLGYAAGALLAQLLTSLGGVSLYCLAFVTLVSVSLALVASLFLPMPEAGLFFSGSRSEERKDPGGDGDGARSAGAAVHAGRMLRRFLLDCKKCYSSTTVLFFCMWAAAGRCGFYQVAGYMQLLWAYVQPRNFTAYNGAVDAVSTLSGAAATVAAGHVPLDWSVWGEAVLGGFTLLIAGALFLMDLTDDIWISYACFVLFKTVYMQLTTVCTFQIAAALDRKRYALVFGVNSFAGAALQSVLTAVVINTRSLQLTISSQFFIYASYFAAIGLLFTVRGVYTLLRRSATANQAAEGGGVGVADSAHL